MELQLGGGGNARRTAMQAGEGGLWSVEVEGNGLGIDYGYVINGEGPFPDPCSPYQPHGVHGLSRRLDHSQFPWTDNTFQAVPLPAAVIYEMHIGTFTPEGTFDAAILKLDTLRDLGVTHLELMPVAEFPGQYGWGYDGVDLYAPHHAMGGPEGLKRFVDACHARGLGVLLDVVYNHLGPSGNYLEKYGPFHSDRHQTNWGPAMNLDGPGSDGVRQYFIENAVMWLRDYHFDGLRLDAVHALVDNSATHFLEELAQAVDDLEIVLGRHLILIAESELNDPRIVRSREMGGYGIDAQWSDDFHHALHVLLTGESKGYYADFQAWSHLAKALTRVFVYDGCYSRLRNRKHGRPVFGLPASRFLGYIQTHDQVGNRAQGRRISHLVGPELAKVAAALVLTSPFVPMLFQGEEWGASTRFQYFTNHEDEELGKAVSEGRQNEFREFGWMPDQVPDPQNPETFQRSKLKWDEIDQEPHAGILDWHRRLIALRRSHPILSCGRLDQVTVTFDEEAGWLLVDRGGVLTACNLSEHTSSLPLPLEGSEAVLLASNPQSVVRRGGIDLPPQSVVVLELNAER